MKPARSCLHALSSADPYLNCMSSVPCSMYAADVESVSR